MLANIRQQPHAKAVPSSLWGPSSVKFPFLWQDITKTALWILVFFFFLKLHNGFCLPSLVQVGICFWSGKLQFKVVLSQALIWELSGSWDSPGVQTPISPPRLATEKYSYWTSRWRYDHIVSEGLCCPHQTGTEKENCCDFLLSLPSPLLSPSLSSLSSLPSSLTPSLFVYFFFKFYLLSQFHEAKYAHITCFALSQLFLLLYFIWKCFEYI